MTLKKLGKGSTLIKTESITIREHPLANTRAKQRETAKAKRMLAAQEADFKPLSAKQRKHKRLRERQAENKLGGQGERLVKEAVREDQSNASESASS
jgi:hypothetical protein